MTLLSLLGRIMRYFLLRPETLFLLCISLALWSYFFHTDEVKTIVKSSRDAVKMVKGKVAEMMQNERFGGPDVLDAEFSKTWEFKSYNVAVYSIQGRRDHMEDRFEVLTDVVNRSHPSIFGIFDGHGGDVSTTSMKRQNVVFFFSLYMWASHSVRFSLSLSLQQNTRVWVPCKCIYQCFCASWSGSQPNVH